MSRPVNDEKRQVPELLAPAGDWDAMQAALEAGASAVYFGLTTLNARRRARNFRQEELAKAIEAIHAHGARAYLTLNTDIGQRELGQAVRILELARQTRADAVLVRDPALLALKREYPELEFHFSTQTCMANSADVSAAGQLGAARVVLAREMSLSEIAAAAAVPDIQTEVFVQGALCFSVSGRCLLSSWIGGRSGNRGACTSPCRVPWSVAGQARGTPLSMRDLSALGRLDALRRAGVAALKIEGRMKTAAWVGKAVGVYRRALDGENVDALLPEVEQLGAYTGRELTSGYLDGERDYLTGVAGREASPEACEELTRDSESEKHGATAEGETSAAAESADEADQGPTYDLEITVGRGAIACRCRCGQLVEQWSVPKTVVRRVNKAVSIDQVFDFLGERSIQGRRLREATTDDPAFLLVPRAVNALMDRISAVIHRARKAPDEQIHVQLPESVNQILTPDRPHAANRRSLGDEPDRARVDASSLASFAKQVRPKSVIVEGLNKDTLARALAACRGVPMIVALPQVFFEKDVSPLEALLAQCATAELPVEVNSWGGWRLARQAGVRMESGPGLAVLNSLAARVLLRHGLECVTLSPEADRRQLEALSAHCPAPCSLVVFGRPALLTTRARLSEADMAGQVFEDRRGAKLAARLERGLWVFRPVDPFDLRATSNDRIRVEHLVVDLVGSPDPVGDWHNAPVAGDKPFRFNYDRMLV